MEIRSAIPSDTPAVFDALPHQTRHALLRLRQMILDVAKTTHGAGQLSETVKWGQPSYEAIAPKTGTPVRIGVPKSGGVALYVHCQTTVIARARDVFSDSPMFEGNRAVLMPLTTDWPEAPLRQIIRSALTYRM